MRRNLSARCGNYLLPLMRRAGTFGDLRLHLDGTLPPLATFHPHLPFSTVPVVFSACSWRALTESHPASVFKDTSTTCCYSPDIFMGWWWSLTQCISFPYCCWNAGSAPRTGSWTSQVSSWQGVSPEPAHRQVLEQDTAQQKALGHWLGVFAVKGKVSNPLQKNMGNGGKLRWKHSLKESKDGYSEDHTLEQIYFQLLLPSNSHTLFCPIQFSSVLLFLTPLWTNILHTSFIQVQLLPWLPWTAQFVSVSIRRWMRMPLLAAIHLSHFCTEMGKLHLHHISPMSTVLHFNHSHFTPLHPAKQKSRY